MSNSSILLSVAEAPFIDHLPEYLRLFDEAALWLASQGRTGQWGDKPPSSQPGFVQRWEGQLRKTEEMGMTTIFARANKDSPIIGIMSFNEFSTADSGMPLVGERALYVHLLITTRDSSYRGLGQRLLAEAKEEAGRRDIGLLRLSCYAGEDGKLITTYERMGFRRNLDKVIYVPNWEGGDPWPKMVLEMKLEKTSSESV